MHKSLLSLAVVSTLTGTALSASAGDFGTRVEKSLHFGAGSFFTATDR